jgi:hypothetical protein
MCTLQYDLIHIRLRGYTFAERDYLHPPLIKVIATQGKLFNWLIADGALLHTNG